MVEPDPWEDPSIQSHTHQLLNYNANKSNRAAGFIIHRLVVRVPFLPLILWRVTRTRQPKVRSRD